MPLERRDVPVVGGGRSIVSSLVVGLDAPILQVELHGADLEPEEIARPNLEVVGSERREDALGQFRRVVAPTSDVSNRSGAPHRPSGAPGSWCCG